MIQFTQIFPTSALNPTVVTSVNYRSKFKFKYNGVMAGKGVGNIFIKNHFGLNCSDDTYYYIWRCVHTALAQFIFGFYLPRNKTVKRY